MQKILMPVIRSFYTHKVELYLKKLPRIYKKKYFLAFLKMPVMVNESLVTNGSAFFTVLQNILSYS